MECDWCIRDFFVILRLSMRNSLLHTDLISRAWAKAGLFILLIAVVSVAGTIMCGCSSETDPVRRGMRTRSMSSPASFSLLPVNTAISLTRTDILTSTGFRKPSTGPCLAPTLRLTGICGPMEVYLKETCASGLCLSAAAP